MTRLSEALEPEFVEQALGLGANDYWVKASFDFKQLKDRLDQLIPNA